MKRLHIHVGVENLGHAIQFYSALFGMEPVKVRQDYAKWMLEDPRVNFAISTRAKERGVDHLGIQVDGDNELSELRDRLKIANMKIISEGESLCCYARSEKSWIYDPSEIPWETYRTMGDAEIFHADKGSEFDCDPPQSNGSSCCAPQAESNGCCG